MSKMMRVPAISSLIERQQLAFEQVARAVPGDRIIEDLLLWVEGHENIGAVTSVFWLSEDGRRFLKAAAPNLPESLCAAILGATIGDDSCSCAAAARRGEAVLVDDIESHANWRAQGELAISHGLRACWSIPILGIDGTALGSLAMYHRARRKAGDDDRHFLAALSHTIGLVREWELREAALADSRTNLDHIREQLNNAQRLSAAGQLAAGFAHDFNNCLAIVTGNVELALNSLRDAEHASAIPVLKKAMRGAEQAAALARRLVTVSLPQALHRRDVDVGGLLEGIADEIEYLAGDLIAVKIVVPKGLWCAHVDGRELENAIFNLVINARHAMPDGGHLTVRAANDPMQGIDSGIPCLLISVIDTGVGMSQQVLEQSAKPFFTTKQGEFGSGLGLSQVQDFARRSGGKIRISSQPGNGTTVDIFLPAAGRQLASEAIEMKSLSKMKAR